MPVQVMMRIWYRCRLTYWSYCNRRYQLIELKKKNKLNWNSKIWSILVFLRNSGDWNLLRVELPCSCTGCERMEMTTLNTGCWHYLYCGTCGVFIADDSCCHTPYRKISNKIHQPGRWQVIWFWGQKTIRLQPFWLPFNPTTCIIHMATPTYNTAGGCQSISLLLPHHTE